MRVLPFTDQYDLLARLTGSDPQELRARDASRPQPVRRWLTVDDGGPRAAVTALMRPDDRLFLARHGDDPQALVVAAVATRREVALPVHLSVDEGETELITCLEEAGFETELVSEYFTVSFEDALRVLQGAWVPTGYSVHPVSDGDPDELFELDNRLRDGTPGTDGWRGNREWFDAELEDPAAYYFARHGTEAVALVRVWKNPSGPRFGFIGVVPEHRGTTLAAALIRTALTEAATWGHETFVTETALTNSVVHPRLSRLAQSRDGRFRQMVLR